MHRQLHNPRSLRRATILFSIVASLLTLFIQSGFAQSASATEGNLKALSESLYFHAPFDSNGDARTSRADGRLYTTESLARKEWTLGIQRDDVSIAKGAGVFGDCIRFADKNPKVICYRGEVLPYGKGPWAGTVCFWMRLDADKDLKPGYCDPIQITTNDSPSKAALYLDGKLQGTIVDPMKFNWELDKTAVMIGIEYIGDLDELMLFDRALDEKDLQLVIQGKVSK